MNPFERTPALRGKGHKPPTLTQNLSAADNHLQMEKDLFSLTGLTGYTNHSWEQVVDGQYKNALNGIFGGSLSNFVRVLRDILIN